MTEANLSLHDFGDPKKVTQCEDARGGSRRFDQRSLFAGRTNVT